MSVRADGPTAPARAWVAPLVVGGISAAVYPWLAPDARLWANPLIAALSIPAILWGVRRHQPRAAWPWRLIAVAHAMFVVGDLLVHAVEPVSVDPLHLVAYGVLVVAVLGFGHLRQSLGERDNLLDSGLIVTALGILGWSFLFDPLLYEGTVNGSFWQIAYPAAGLLLTAVAGLVIMPPAGRSPAAALLAAGVVVLPLGEAVRSTAALSEDVGLATLALIAWLGHHAFIASMALHPSMRGLTDPVPAQPRPLRGARFWLHLATALLAPAVFGIRLLAGHPLDLTPLLFGATILSLLVIARVLGERRRADAAVVRTLATIALLQRVAHACNESQTMREAIEAVVREVTTNLGYELGHAYLPGGGEEDRASDIWYPVDHPPLEAPRTHAAFPVTSDGELVAVLEFFSSAPSEEDHALALVAEAASTQIGRVRERETSARELVVARDEALETSRLKSDFLAVMSHEIRTPMNAVIGMTGLLLDTDLDDRQRHYAASVRSAGESLLTVLNDILDFSKMEAGRFTLESVDFQVDRLVEEVADLLGEAAADKPVDVFSYCYPGTPVTLRGDAGRLRQVLVNLVGNAVKFTAEGEVVVRVRAVPGTVDAAHATLQFEVVDTGIGIEPAMIDRLFEPFEQADRSTTRRFGGTGLGLSICRRLVELMGGTIAVRSTPEKGSVFSFRIPYARRPASEHERRPALPLSGRRALVLDDNATNREIIEQQVSAWGMRVDVTATGEEALATLTDAARSGNPHVLALLDLNMPGMDGFEVARRISADPLLAHVRLAMLTSSEGADEAVSAEEAGIDVFLRKPVRQSQLYDALMHLVLPDAVRERSAETPAPVQREGTLLLVEDNPANQLVGAKLAERLGYHVDVISDGSEALDALERRPYDAILMDCQMPIMDGFEATRRIRDLPNARSRTPVIALTASAMAEDRERCFAAGMDDFITKPVHPDDLASVLARWVPAGPDPDAGPAVPADGERGGVTAPDVAPSSADAGSGPGAAPLLDRDRWQLLVDLTAERPEALAGMVDAFVHDVPQRLVTIAAHAEGPVAAQRAAHSLKGGGASLGAAALSVAAGAVEARLHDGHAPSADELAVLRAVADGSVRALRAALRERVT